MPQQKRKAYHIFRISICSRIQECVPAHPACPGRSFWKGVQASSDSPLGPPQQSDQYFWCTVIHKGIQSWLITLNPKRLACIRMHLRCVHACTGSRNVEAFLKRIAVAYRQNLLLFSRIWEARNHGSSFFLKTLGYYGYDRTRTVGSERKDLERPHWEMCIICEHSYSNRINILGTCRGVQVIVCSAVDKLLHRLLSHTAVRIQYHTTKAWIMGPCARTLELPLQARTGVSLCFLFVWDSGFFGVLFTPFPKEEILDPIAHGSFVLVTAILLQR